MVEKMENVAYFLLLLGVSMVFVLAFVGLLATIVALFLGAYESFRKRRG